MTEDLMTLEETIPGNFTTMDETTHADFTTMDKTTHGDFTTLEDTTEVGTATSATGSNYSTTMEPATL